MFQDEIKNLTIESGLLTQFSLSITPSTKPYEKRKILAPLNTSRESNTGGFDSPILKCVSWNFPY